MRSLWAKQVLGVLVIVKILYQYVLLNRSLSQVNKLRKKVDSKVIFLEKDLIWNDGMYELKELFLPNIEATEFLSGNQDIKLNTLADYDWYIRFANSGSR